LFYTFRCWQQVRYWRDNVTLWEHALEAGGDSHIAHMNLAVVCLQKEMYEPAAHHFRQTLRLDPENSSALHDLGFALLRQGKVQEALEQSRECVRRFPEWAQAHHSLGVVLRQLGRIQESLWEYNQEAWLLATHPDANSRNGDRALLLAREVCAAAGHEEARFLDTLAAAYAETGDFGRAVETAKRALAAASSNHLEDLIKEIRGRIKLYEEKRPFRIVAGSTQSRSP
jgi:tetratricopeptide (TPR) repeat protein